MSKKPLVLRLIRFAMVGGVVAGLHSALIWIFHAKVGVGPRTSFWMGYFPAITVHFCLTKWWTFRCTRSDLLRQVRNYAAAAAAAAVVQFAIYHVTLLWFTSNANLAYLVAAVLGMGLSYVLFQTRVFNSVADPAPGEQERAPE